MLRAIFDNLIESRDSTFWNILMTLLLVVLLCYMRACSKTNAIIADRNKKEKIMQECETKYGKEKCVNYNWRTGEFNLLKTVN